MISVIVPVYNIEKYIERCILSVINQTYADFELLLINDGSTDSSYEICKKWEETDKRIKLISKTNGGVSSARNLGLDHASGDFIFFVDGDDWLSHDCFQTLMEHMTDDIDLVIGEHQDKNDDDGYVPPEYTSHKNYEGVITPQESINDFYQFEFYTKVIWAKLYRKELWENLRFNHMVYSEDTFAMFHVIEHAKKIYSVQKPIYYYLQRASGASRELKVLEFENYLETLMFMYHNALEKYSEYKESLAEYYNGFAYVLLKKYQKLGEKEKALKLIKQMKFVYNASETKNPSFSQKILFLPGIAIYYLIGIKNLFSNS